MAEAQMTKARPGHIDLAEANRHGSRTVKQRIVSFTPPMLDFRITLEARNPARHCLRQYRVEAGTDLFGSWVEISYGRIGTKSVCEK